MNILDYVYLRESTAIAQGMTHEGRMFGLPSYVASDGDVVIGCPKVPLLQVWCILVDGLMHAACYFLSEDVVLETPIYVGRPLGRSA